MREEGLFGDVGVADDVPSVGGEIGAVDDERADRSFAGGLLELVGPAAVVGEGFAAEEGGVVGGRVVDEAEDDFAFDVDVGEVVPVELGCGDAVADPDDGGVERDGGGELLVEDDEVIGEFEMDGCAGFWEEREGGFDGVGFDAGEVDLLEVGAVVAAGFEAVAFELAGDELCGELAAALAGIAAFEEIVGEVLVVGADGLGADGGLCGGNGGWQGGLCGEGKREGEQSCGEEEDGA